MCTALAFLIFFALIAEIGPSRAMVFTYVSPAVAAVLGVAILDEELTFGIVAGFAARARRFCARDAAFADAGLDARAGSRVSLTGREALTLSR